MPKVLIVDEFVQMGALADALQQDHGIDSDLAATIETAHTLLPQGQYFCAVVEPYIREFRGRESESPMRGLVRSLNDRKISVIIVSTYFERDLASFGFSQGRDYAAYVGKPATPEETIEKMMPFLKQQ